MSNIDDETLVSYLDGELPNQEADQVERELESDDNLRQRLDGLRKTWVLLEDLPEPEPNPDLARSTLELVTLQIEQEQTSWTKNLFRSKLFVMALGCLTLSLLGAGAGSLLTRAWQTEREANLTYAADFDAFREIPSVEWLESLEEIENLVIAFPSDPIGDEVVPVGDDLEENKVWLASLNEIDLAILQDNERDFANLKTDEKDAIKSVIDHVNNSDFRLEKLDVARAFGELLANQTPRVAAQIRNNQESSEKRLQLVRQIVNNRMLSLYPSIMTTEEQDGVREWAHRNWLTYADAPEFLSPEIVPDEMLAELDWSDRAKAILEPLSQEMRRLPLSVWITSVTNPGRKTDISDEEMLSKLEELGGDLEQSRTYQEIELMSEDEARRMLQRMVRDELDQQNQ